MAIKLDLLEVENIYNKDGEQTLNLTGDQGIVVSGASTFAGNIATASTKKLLFDGASGHTYIAEESDSNLKFYVAGTEQLNITNGGLHFNASLTIPGYINHAGDSGTKFGFEGNDAFRLYTASTMQLQINSSGNSSFYGDLSNVGASHTVSLSSGSNIRGSNHLFLQGDASYVHIKSNGNNVYIDGSTHYFRNVAASANYLTLSSTRALFNGEVEAASLDINGNADIAGTLSLDDTLTVNNATGTSQLFLTGTGNGYVNAAVILQCNDDNGHSRGAGVYMNNVVGATEWFAGRPYSDGDSYKILRRHTTSGNHNNSTANPATSNTVAVMDIDSSGNVVFSGQLAGTSLDINGDVTIINSIIHSGDPDTYFGFHNNDGWRVVTGGTERFEITNSGATFTGDLDVNGGDFYVALAGAMQHGNYSKRQFSSGYFANGTANLGVILQFPNNPMQGYLKITLSNSYSHQNATGELTKIIPFGWNPNGSIWGAGADYAVNATGPIANNFTIGDIVWNSSNSTFDIPIYHIVSTGNSIKIIVEYFGGSAQFLESVTLTSPASVTIPTAYATKHNTRVHGSFEITADGSNATIMSESGSGDFEINTVGDIVLDAGGGDITLRDDGTTFGELEYSGGSFNIVAKVADSDIRFYGNDGGSSVTALTLDMSAGGNATFAGTIAAATTITAGTTFISDAVSATNGNPGTDNVWVSGYGVIGNRDQLYFTNHGNKIVFGVGAAHNAGNKLIISSATSAFSNNITSTGTITGTTLTGTSLDINGVGNVSGILSVASKLYLEANTSQIQVGANWNTGVLQFLNGPTTAVEFDIPNGRIKNNLGRYLTASGGNNNHFGSFDNYSMSLVTNNTPRLTINNAGNATFAGTIGSGTIISTGTVKGQRLQAESSTFPQQFIIDSTSGGGNSRTMQVGMSGSTLYFKKSDATGSIIFRNSNNTNLMTLGLADTGQVTVLNELQAGSLDINGNAAIDGLTTLTHSAHPLTINRTGGATALIELEINGTTEGFIGATSTKSFVVYNETPAERFSVSNAGVVTATNDVIAFSDRKLKENIKTLDGKKVLDMRGVSFTRKDTGAESSGVIAQEIQKVAPELVHDTEGTLGVAYGNLVGYLIEAVKDQQKQIDELKAIINGNSK